MHNTARTENAIHLRMDKLRRFQRGHSIESSVDRQSINQKFSEIKT